MADQIFTPGMMFTQTSSFAEQVQADGTNIPVPGYAFDAATDEAVFMRTKAIGYTSGNLTVDLKWYADTASANDVVWGAAIAVITPNTDTQDIETDALATEATVTDSHLGTTGQRLHEATITVSSLDSLAADDDLVLRVRRLGANGSDTMTGDAILTEVHLSYS